MTYLVYNDKLDDSTVAKYRLWRRCKVQGTRIPESEYRFLQIIWQKGSISSGQLVTECAEQLGWQKSTTYTVLKRLCEKGVLKNENSVITTMISQEKAQQLESKEIVKSRFGGSLSQFIVSYMTGQGLPSREAERLKQIIEAYRDS